MSVRATDFASAWVAENINADAYDPGQNVIDGHVQQLLADAKEDGIAEDELREDLGDLSDFISEALEAATDNEVKRMAGRDD